MRFHEGFSAFLVRLCSLLIFFFGMPENLLEPSFLIIDFPYLANILFISKITEMSLGSEIVK